MHSNPSWLSDNEFRYETACCGETTEHRHSVRFLDYRPKHGADTMFDYRPALTLDVAGVPADVDLAGIGDLVARMDRLIAAALKAPGSL